MNIFRSEDDARRMDADYLAQLPGLMAETFWALNGMGSDSFWDLPSMG